MAALKFPKLIHTVPSPITGQHQGTSYKAVYRPSAKNAPASIVISFAVKWPLRLILRRENWFFKLGKKIGLAEEPRLGGSQFDRQFYIDAHPRRFVGQILNDSTTQEKISLLFSQHHATVFEIDSKELKFTFSPFRHEEDPDQKTIRMLIDTVAAILDRIVPMIQQTRPTEEIPISAFYILTLPIPLFVLSIFIFLFHLAFPPFNNALYTKYLYWLPIALGGFLSFAYPFCQNRLRGVEAFFGSLALTITALTLLTTCGPVFYNGFFDRGATFSREYPAVGTHYTRDKNRYSYYVEVAAPHNPRRRVRASYSDYQLARLNPSQYNMLVTMQPGALGEPWITGAMLKQK